MRLPLVPTTFYDKVQSSACTPTSTQPKVIMINLTLGKSYETYFIPSPVLFHCPPSLISLSFHSCLASNFIAYPALFHSCLVSNFIAYPALFHSCLAFNFIAYPALFHFHFIPAWLLISLPTQPYFIAISFLPGFSFHCLPSLIPFLPGFSFHCLPSLISLPFHMYFIVSLAIFLCHFIPISLPA